MQALPKRDKAMMETRDEAIKRMESEGALDPACAYLSHMRRLLLVLGRLWAVIKGMGSEGPWRDKC